MVGHEPPSKSESKWHPYSKIVGRIFEINVNFRGEFFGKIRLRNWGPGPVWHDSQQLERAGKHVLVPGARRHFFAIFSKLAPAPDTRRPESGIGSPYSPRCRPGEEEVPDPPIRRFKNSNLSRRNWRSREVSPDSPGACGHAHGIG